MQPVERSSPDGVDYGQVIRMTFVTVILIGSPIVTVPSMNAGLQTQDACAEFAIRVGAVIWLVTVVVLFVYAKRTNVDDGGTPPEAELSTDIDAED